MALDSRPVPYARLSTFSDGHFRTGENLRTDWEERTPFWRDAVNGLVIFELKTLKICDFSIYIIVVLGTCGIEW